MKKNMKSIVLSLLIFSVLLISAGAVSAVDANDVGISDTSLASTDSGILNDINNANGNNSANIADNQNVNTQNSASNVDNVNNAEASTYSADNNVPADIVATYAADANKTNTTLTINNDSIEYGTPYNYTANLTYQNGSAISGQELMFNLYNQLGQNKTYWATTNNEGIAKLAINLIPGNWTLQAVYPENENLTGSQTGNSTLIITPVNVVLNTTDLNKTYGDGQNFNITATDAAGNKLANSTIDVTIITQYGNKTYTVTTNENGTAILPVGLNAGEYQFITTFKGDYRYNATSVTNNITILKVNTTLSQTDFTVNRKGEYYKTTLTDKNGNILANQNVEMTLNFGNNVTKTYNVTTNEYGNAKLAINLNPGTYSINCNYLGDVNYNAADAKTNTIVMYNSSVKMNTTLTGYNQTFTAKNQTYKVYLRENNELLLPNRQVTLTLTNAAGESKNYTQTTNSVGVVDFTINLNDGTYTITSTYAGSTLFNGCNTTNTLIVKLA